jgi:hypothetical protein
VRRFDETGDEKLTHAGFLRGIDPLEPYSKVLVNEIIENRELLSYMSSTKAGSSVSDAKSVKSLGSKKSGSPERANRKTTDSKQDLGSNPVLEKAFERFIKSDEFVGCSPLKYRRPFPADDFIPKVTEKKKDAAARSSSASKPQSRAPSAAHSR